MTDRATIRYPYRTDKARLRWGRWTGSQAGAFTAGSEALGGLTAHEVFYNDETGGHDFSWLYIDAVTKARWAVSTGDVIMLGAAMIARLPAAEMERAPAPEPQPATHPDCWLKDAVNELKADGVTFTDKQPQQPDAFDELVDAWAEKCRPQLVEDPT